jgi:hypothetical protein
MKKVLTIVLTVVVVLGGSGVLLAKPADAATPGDLLYPLDLAAEAVERVITTDPVAAAELELDILEERTEELDSLAEVAGVSDDTLDSAVDAVDAQNDRVQQRLQDLQDADGLQDGALEQVQNRYETQVEEHSQTMNQVETKVQDMGEATQLKIDNAVENLKKGATATSSNNGNTENESNSTNGNSNN